MEIETRSKCREWLDHRGDPEMVYRGRPLVRIDSEIIGPIDEVAAVRVNGRWFFPSENEHLEKAAEKDCQRAV